MELRVKTFLGRVFIIEVSEFETVKQFKEKLFREIKTTAGFRLRWKFNRVETIGLMAERIFIDADDRYIRDIRVRGKPLKEVKAIFLFDRSGRCFSLLDPFF